MKRELFLFIAVLVVNCAKADGILMSWSHSNLYGVDKERFEASQKWTIDEIINKNSKVDEWPETYLMLNSAIQYKEDKTFLNSLIQQLTDNTVVKLKNTSRLIVWERITNGDIVFEGKGLQVDDDIFKTAGRANFILRNITGKNFGIITINSSSSDLDNLKSKWLKFLSGINIDEYKSSYTTEKKGFKEIQSLSALEALIFSLRDTEQKKQITEQCLKKVYNLDEMPTDKSSPAQYCNPDTYTYGYLAMLTGEKTDKTKNAEYWAKWWIDNKDNIYWSPENGTFRIK